MKILKVKCSDMNDVEAERKFYAIYTPTKETIKKNVDKMYSILYQLNDSAIKKEEELTKEMQKTPGVQNSARIWGKSSNSIWNDYPAFKKRMQEIERMRAMADHIQFMINELGLVGKW